MVKRKEKEFSKLLENRLKQARKDYARVLKSKKGDSRFLCAKVKSLFDLMEEIK